MTLILALGISSCGDEDEDEVPAVIEYASVTVEASNSEEDGTYSLTSATCSSNSDSGLFQGTFSNGTENELLVKIKGFSTAGGTYSCTQASDNGTGTVGNKYDGCSVEMTIPDSSTSHNTYAMHRSADTVKEFTYDGTCSVTTTYEAPRVTGTIVCGGMVQTQYQGAIRNPIDTSVIASIVTESSFYCDI